MGLLSSSLGESQTGFSHSLGGGPELHKLSGKDRVIDRLPAGELDLWSPTLTTSLSRKKGQFPLQNFSTSSRGCTELPENHRGWHCVKCTLK